MWTAKAFTTGEHKGNRSQARHERILDIELFAQDI